MALLVKVGKGLMTHLGKEELGALVCSICRSDQSIEYSYHYYLKLLI